MSGYRILNRMKDNTMKGNELNTPTTYVKDYPMHNEIAQKSMYAKDFPTSILLLIKVNSYFKV